MLEKIHSIDEFNEILKHPNTFLFLKHSLTCPISASAYDEYKHFIENQNEYKGYYLAVQDSRELSSHIAETFGIKHESPQAFIISDGKPTWNASHWDIKESTLKNELEK